VREDEKPIADNLLNEIKNNNEGKRKMLEINTKLLQDIEETTSKLEQLDKQIVNQLNQLKLN